MTRRAILSTALLSVAIPLFWSLDANFLLLFYDAYLTRSGSSSVVISNSDGIARRAFRPGSTPLEGKTIWITGASSGIGAELALQLTTAGAGHLILSGRRKEKLESVGQSCLDASRQMTMQADGHREDMRVSIVPFDMLSPPDVLDAAVSNAIEAASPANGIDILVLNAGQYQLSPALETDLDVALPDLMQINFASPVQLSQKLMRRNKWKERGHGHVVAVASVMGRGPCPLNALYSATKHALMAYFHSLAGEERSWLRVDVALPGATATGLWNASSRRGIAEDSDSNNSQAEEREPHADDRSKMSVDRCARLIISGMIGPNAFFFETWVAKNPGLLWAYLAYVMPTMHHWLVKEIVAPIRLDMWRKTGEDGLYVPTLLGHVWSCVVDYFAGESDRLLPRADG